MSCTVISQRICSNHKFTYLWNDIYENLVVKSVGLNLFSLLGSSSSSSVDASLFGCVDILYLYLTLNFVISSLIVGTYKSPCMTLLDVYHGACAIARRALFWYLLNISMFELLAVLQGASMSIWALEWFCRSVTYFLLIAPIFFLESNTFVGISAPAVFFQQICEFATSFYCRDIYLSIWQFLLAELSEYWRERK